jgi:hypothetical protein
MACMSQAYCSHNVSYHLVGYWYSHATPLIQYIILANRLTVLPNSLATIII